MPLGCGCPHLDSAPLRLRRWLVSWWPHVWTDSSCCLAMNGVTGVAGVLSVYIWCNRVCELLKQQQHVLLGAA